MNKILVLAFSNLKQDARVMRQINFLKKKYELTVSCYDINESTDYQIVKLPISNLTFLRKLFLGFSLLLKRYTSAHKLLYPYGEYLATRLVKEKFNIIIANDIETLPLAFNLKKQETKIIFDAHEYSPRQFEDKLWWRIFFQSFNTFFCKKYIPKVHAMMTVGQALAEEYEKEFKVKPMVITNACPYQPLKPLETDKKTVKLVHHGIVNRSRKIELTIAMMDYLPDHFTLDLILVTPSLSSAKTRKYFNELKKATEGNKRIRFKDPVPIDKIISELQQYDLGIILIPPINFNYANCLPNKFFDYIQARIGIISGPTPEIMNLVKKYNLGVIAEDFSPISLAKELAALTNKNIEEFKGNSNLAAQKFNSEINEQMFNDLVSSLLKT